MSEQLLGVYGRNNGLILLFASVVFFLIILSVSSENLEIYSISSLVVCGWLVLIYFYFQFFGWDLVPWSNSYSVPVSTLGNPNFLSSFLAIFIFAGLGKYRLGNQTNKSISFLILSVVLGFIALILIDSEQGYILVSIGIWMLVIQFGLRRNWKVIIWTWLIVSFSLVIGVLLGTIDIGPGKKIFDNPSLSIRREYWFAGLSMLKRDLIFGNGMDSYLYNFDANKSKNFIEIYGGSLTSSSAHNIYIDYFQGSGVIAGFFYTLLNLCIALSALKNIRQTGGSYPQWTILIIWILIQAQSIISIQNVAINSWYWLFSGLLVQDQSRSLNKIQKDDRIRKLANTNTVKLNMNRMIYLCIIPALISTLISLSALFQDIRFARAIKTGNGNALIKLVESFPHDTYRTNYTAQALENGRYWYWAIKVAQQSVIENPRNEEGWKLILRSNLSSNLEKKIARDKIEQLDPYSRKT